MTNKLFRISMLFLRGLLDFKMKYRIGIDVFCLLKGFAKGFVLNKLTKLFVSFKNL